MTSQTIQVELIEEGRRLRGIDPAQVASLVASISDIGLLNPITVYRRKVLLAGIAVDGYGLVAGAHRLAAARELGLVEIEANVVTLSELERQIAECDENLCGPTLTPSERALFTARRKEAYEALHPETRAGVAGADARWNATDNLSTASFAAETAKVSGKDERTVRRDAERGDKVSSEALELVRGTKLDTGTYLDKLKKLTPDEQVRAVQRDLSALKEKVDKTVEQAKNDASADEARAKLDPAVQEHIRKQQAAVEARKGKADAYYIASLEAEIEELREANASLKKELAEVKAENKLYAEMRAQFEAGGFEAVMAGKDEEIRVLKGSVARESADKASWMRSAKHWQKQAIDLGWKDPSYIEIPRTSSGAIADDMPFFPEDDAHG